MQRRAISDEVQEQALLRYALTKLFQILAIGIFASACGRESPSHRGIVERLIDVEGPSMPFDSASLIGPVFTWSFETPEDLEPWTIGRYGWRISPRGLTLNTTTSQATLDRTVTLEAATIRTLRVDTQRFNGTIDLRWQGPDQTLEETGVVATTQRGLAPRVRSALFDLRDHPGWKGHIEKIRLTFKPSVKRRIILSQIVGTAFQPELLNDAAQKAWKLEFGNDVRNAFHALPERPLELRLEVPEQAELRFALGAPGTLPAPFLFRIAALSGDDERQTLFERTVTPETTDLGEGRWWDEKLDLSHLAGRNIVIRLENEIAAPLTPETGFPAWGNVEVIARRLEPKPPNVVLISIDTLRADRLSAYGYHRATSPNIDAWARESATLFERTVAPSPWTQPSHVSMFSGFDAHRHGVNDFDAAPEALKLLPEILRQTGYVTAAITAGGFMHPRFGLSQGFDTYFSSEQAYSHSELETGLGLALNWLENQRDNPFFLFFHTYEVHSPYDARQPFFSRWSSHDPTLVVNPRSAKLEDEGKPTFIYWTQDDKGPGKPLPPELTSLPSDLYDSAVAYTDHELGRLFGWLRDSNLEDNTIVVLTSDHGEMLGEHDTASHGYLYDENLLVPLIIASPDKRGAGTKVAEQVRLIDLTPTVLELAGLPAPDGIDGVSLLELIEGQRSRIRRPAFSYASLRQRGLSLRLDNRLKYIRWVTAFAPRHGQERVFNLVDDPREKHNLLATERIFDGTDTPPPDTSPRIETLREMLRKAWTTNRSGFRLHIDNPGLLSFSGTLHGSSARPNNLKAFDLPCPCITREDDATIFQMPPEKSYSLEFESWRNSQNSLHLTITTPDGSGFRLRFNSDFFEPQVAAYADGTWQQLDLDQVDDEMPRITFRWHGDQQLDTTSSELESDPSLIQDLKALGYLE